MNNIKKFILVFSIVIFSVSLVSCKAKKSESKENKKNIDVYLDVNDRYSLAIIDEVIKEYEDKNKEVKVNVINPLGNEKEVLEVLESGKNLDVIIGDRETEILLSEKSLATNLTGLYESEKLNKKFYNVYNSYSRVGNLYYSTGIIPYSFEIAYNKETLKELKLKEPKDFKECLEIIKICKEKNIKIPYVLNQDISLEEVLFSLFLTDYKGVDYLTEMYGGDEEKYIKEPFVVNTLSKIEKYVKEGYIKESVFIKGDEKELENFMQEKSPIIFTTSYFGNKIKNGEIKLLEDMGYLDQEKIIRPIIMNNLVLTMLNGKNDVYKKDFQKFVIDSELQDKLKDSGFITGNVEVNKKLNGIKAQMAEHIFESSSENIIYKYNLPKNVQKKIEKEVKNILMK